MNSLGNPKAAALVNSGACAVRDNYCSTYLDYLTYLNIFYKQILAICHCK